VSTQNLKPASQLTATSGGNRHQDQQGICLIDLPKQEQQKTLRHHDHEHLLLQGDRQQQGKQRQ